MLGVGVEGEFSVMDGVKKASSPERLAELALIDPKHAKRLSSTELQRAVLRNFLMEDGASPLKYLAKGVLRGRGKDDGALIQVAQNSSEKSPFADDRRCDTKRDTTGLTAEDKELKLRLQAWSSRHNSEMGPIGEGGYAAYARAWEALNEALRQEVQRLRIATGQVPPGNGNSAIRGLFPQLQMPFSGQQNHQQ
ncbi:hypothetical protein Cgig2_010012 [Carnegiea gigantea]|uniref:Uncharacterized protein n=1 Tax=Carnegiea gigantea TaxID=171969 RepID=A0A9Q1JQE0_9CARY|nr:hypothetical protein Cgig2_010012 [Carnegiea gigantea]